MSRSPIRTNCYVLSILPLISGIKGDCLECFSNFFGIVMVFRAYFPILQKILYGNKKELSKPNQASHHRYNEEEFGQVNI